MKKDTLIYILLALSGYVFMYMATLFTMLEANVLIWDAADRLLLIGMGTVISLTVILIKGFRIKRKP